jgi:DNA-binding response OmpR family regulator
VADQGLWRTDDPLLHAGEHDLTASWCPCCGQPIDRDRLIVDLNTNVVVYGGKQVLIGKPQVAALLHGLAEAWPKTVSHSDLGYAIWGLCGPERMRESIAVHVSLARKVINPLGLSIEPIEGRGYRLVESRH